ncbi:hypothetical protein JCM8097_001218 [Rhodosporidiobolus ruineniae]
MASADTTTAQASASLLRLTVSFLAQVDPVHGLKATAARRVVDELREWTEEYGVGTSSVDDLRVRQDTNSALSRTCQAFHRAVSPILAAERHIFTPRQLLAVASALNLDAADDAKAETKNASQIRQVSIMLTTEQLERNPGDSWCGRLVEPLGLQLFTRSGCKSLRLRFHPEASQTPVDDIMITPQPRYNSLLRACGMSVSDWCGFLEECFKNLEEVEVPVFGRNFLFTASLLDGILNFRSVTAARFGTSAVPYEFSSEDVKLDLEQLDHRGTTFDICHLELLSAPFLNFAPTDFLPLIRPSLPSSPPRLRHLDITFELVAEPSDLETGLSALTAIFAALAPTLRRLALRIRFDGYNSRDAETANRGVATAIALCTRLEHLEVGGRPLRDDLLPLVLPSLPRLQHLSVLPLLGLFDIYRIPDLLADHLPSGLRSLVLCVPDDVELDADAGWTERPMRRAVELCARRTIRLELEARRVEERWMDGQL